MPTLRSTPLQSPEFEWFSTNFLKEEDEPLVANARSREEAKKALSYTEAEINTMWPPGGTEKDKAAQAVIDQWKNPQGIYEPRDVYDACQLREPFKSWKWRLSIPNLLNAKQAAFLLARATAYKGKGAVTQNLFNPRHPKHPFPVVTEPRQAERSPQKVRTKVGKTYGTWTVVDCLSESENTSKNAKVKYLVSCRFCGYQRELEYRTMNRACPACVDSSRVAGELREPMALFVLDTGALVYSETQPENSVGVYYIKTKGEPYFMESFEDKPVEALPEPETESEAEQKAKLVEIVPTIPGF